MVTNNCSTYHWQDKLDSVGCDDLGDEFCDVHNDDFLNLLDLPVLADDIVKVIYSLNIYVPDDIKLRLIYSIISTVYIAYFISFYMRIDT